MRDTAFIVHNTQMLLFSMSIIKQNNIANRSLIIISGLFNGSRETYKRLINKSGKTGEIYIKYIHNRIDCFKYALRNKIKYIYIDNDCGFRNYVTLMFLIKANENIHINVFEDGVGTYRADLYVGLKKKLFDALGIGTFMGGCRYTNSVYVLDPGWYREAFPQSNKKIVKVDYSPFDVLMHEIDFWRYIFMYENNHVPTSDICGVYISSWEINKEAISEIFKSSFDMYIKPHPRLKGEVKIGNAVTIGHNAPAELVLADLAMVYKKIIVYHHGSSVELYAKDNKFEYFKI